MSPVHCRPPRTAPVHAAVSSLKPRVEGGLTSSRSRGRAEHAAKWTVRPRLMAVGGVANVAIWGQRARQIQVHVDPERLQANNVTLDQVLTASRCGGV